MNRIQKFFGKIWFCWFLGDHRFLVRDVASKLPKDVPCVYCEKSLSHVRERFEMHFLNRWYVEKDIAGREMVYFAAEIYGDEMDILGCGVGGDGVWCDCGIFSRVGEFEGLRATEFQVEQALLKAAPNVLNAMQQWNR